MSSLKNFQDDWTVDQVVSWLESADLMETKENVELGIQLVAILQELGMDGIGVMAGLLQSLFDELRPFSEREYKCVEAHFGIEVLALYRSINRMRQLSDLLSAGIAGHSRVETDEENLRKMLIAMVDDVRVVQICLANQLVLLRASKSKPVAFQKRQAKLTRDVYAPLANRLGMGQLKWQLEDSALRYLQPKTYHTLAKELEEKRQAREHYIAQLVSTIQTHFGEDGVDAVVHGRAKNIYSIWKKMQRKDLQFKQLWDIRGIRILVHSIEDCYVALSVIHSIWKHIPNQFSDYISMPKSNGYQSIHSVVIGPKNKTVEVQIRTYEMHEESELGVAAHWRYKEALGQDDNIDTKIVWLRRLLDWKDEVMGATVTEGEQAGEGDLQDVGEKNQIQKDQSQKNQSQKNQRIYVFTPKGTIVDLPIGSTPIDFAYAIHSEVGHRTRGAKVNGKMVPLNYPLQTTEQVHIQTVKTGGPSRDWLRNDLGGVQTNRARGRILHWFKRADYDQNMSEGRGMLERELHRLGLDDLSYEKINQHTHFQKIEDMLAAIGAKDFKLSKALYPFRPTMDDTLESITKARQFEKKQPKTSFSVHGVGNLLTRMAKCCQPVPGDNIIGFIASGRGVSIHRSNCNNILHIDEKLTNRLIDVDWGQQSQSTYNLKLWVTAYHRSELLHEVTETLKAANANVLSVTMETDQEHVTRLQLRLEIAATMRPEQLISRLSAIQNVFEVRRD